VGGGLDIALPQRLQQVLHRFPDEAAGGLQGVEQVDGVVDHRLRVGAALLAAGGVEVGAALGDVALQQLLGDGLLALAEADAVVQVGGHIGLRGQDVAPPARVEQVVGVVVEAALEERQAPPGGVEAHLDHRILAAGGADRFDHRMYELVQQRVSGGVVADQDQVQPLRLVFVPADQPALVAVLELGAAQQVCRRHRQPLQQGVGWSRWRRAGHPHHLQAPAAQRGQQGGRRCGSHLPHRDQVDHLAEGHGLVGDLFRPCCGDGTEEPEPPHDPPRPVHRAASLAGGGWGFQLGGHAASWDVIVGCHRRRRLDSSQESAVISTPPLTGPTCGHTALT
jgi:hypothetical protein